MIAAFMPHLPSLFNYMRRLYECSAPKLDLGTNRLKSIVQVAGWVDWKRRSADHLIVRIASEPKNILNQKRDVRARGRQTLRD
jgi:hypothetical protein